MSRLLRARQSYVDNEYISRNVWYEVLEDEGIYFKIKDDQGYERAFLKERSIDLAYRDWELQYDTIDEEEKVLTHVIVPKGACNYLDVGDIFQVRVTNTTNGNTYFEVLDGTPFLLGILEGDAHTNFNPWIPVWNNNPPVINIRKPEHRWAFISNTLDTRSNIRGGKHYDILDETDNKILIIDEEGSEIWMGKNISEYLFGGKPELIK